MIFTQRLAVSQGHGVPLDLMQVMFGQVDVISFAIQPDHNESIHMPENS
jgi:hypothetical protein